MVVHNIFALIKGQDVLNTIIDDDYTDANKIAQAVFGDEAFAVEVTQYPVGIGDKFIEGFFYHIEEDGTQTRIDPIPTAEDEVSRINTENEVRDELEVDNDFRLSMIELGLV